MIVVEMILMGVFATIFMDFFAGFLAKRKLIHPFISPEAIGRWFLYMFQGKFIHEDIHKTPALKNEKVWCSISHYAIGIILAGVYLILELNVPIIRNNAWIALMYGIVTVFLPWFWLLPSTGHGVIASKSSNRSLIIKTNLINHANFGLGLFIWIVTFHRFFI
jgi:hypothetical protein